MTWSDGKMPHDEQLVDGYGAREIGTYYTQDYISTLNRALEISEHEPDLEQ